MAIYAVCVGAIIIAISGFIAAFFDQIFQLDKAMADWEAIDKAALTRFTYHFNVFLIVLVQVMKALIVMSPLFLAIVYFKALLVKSDILIGLVEELHLENIQ